MTAVTFTVPGKPLGKGRPRFYAGRAITPAKTASAEAVIAYTAAPHFPSPLDGPVKLEVTATFAPPASASRKRRVEMLHWPCTKRPDADNIGKLVGDALNGIAYRDDAQVTWLRVTKWWGEQDQLTVKVQEMRGGVE